MSSAATIPNALQMPNITPPLQVAQQAAQLQAIQQETQLRQ